jgi:hypothetical protein
MKQQRFLISLGATILMVLSLLIFQNYTPQVLSYEVDYAEGSGIPMSDIVLETLQHFGNRKALISVEINENEVVYLDRSLDIDVLVINGQLHCDEMMADDVIEIRARVIYVNGVFQCGRQSKPYSKKLIISLKHGNVDPRTSLGHRSLIVNRGGKFLLTGERSRASWTRLAQDARPGDRQLILDKSVQNNNRSWSPGDEIVVGPTSYNPTDAETFIITSVQDNIIGLNIPVKRHHSGVIETYATTYNGKSQIDLRAEVANLNRNILIRSDENSKKISEGPDLQAELGGHVMIMPGGEAYIDSVEFYRLGQAGIMARYPFHWHILGNAPGQYIKNSSIHRSFQRCITVHRTNMVSVINNTCYDFKGHGYFLEDGIEIENHIEGNLGILAKFPHATKNLLASDHPTHSDGMGRHPNVSVFWISNPKNIVKNNVASGSVGTGFWMSFENEIKNSQGSVIARPIRENTTSFEGNIAHSTLVGFTWDGAPGNNFANNPNNPADRRLEPVYYRPSITPVFRKLTAYRNKLTGYYFRGYTAVFDQTIAADNGWNYWFAYNQIIRNSVIVGRTHSFSSVDQNQAQSLVRGDRVMQVGIIQYDGPFEAINVDFVNYPQTKLFHGGRDVTPVPFAVTGGTERLTNISRRVGFNPLPIHRAFIVSNEPSIIGNTSLRDEDGSLSGQKGGAVIVGRESLGVLPSHGCIDGGMTFFNQKVCPGNYQESQLHLFDGMINNSPNPNIWNMPFLVLRDDGALSSPKSLWSQIIHPVPAFRRGGNKFTLANDANSIYKLMFFNLKNPKVWLITESLHAQIPITEVVAQGKNCRMPEIGSVNSLHALKNSTQSAYFANGNKFYFRLLPKWEYEFVVPNNGHGDAQRYISESTNIICDDEAEAHLKGYIDSVLREGTDGSVKVKGWACNFSQNQQVDVKLFVKDPVTQKLILIKTDRANKISEEAVAFECGVAATTGFRYEINLSAHQAAMHEGKRVYVNAVAPDATEIDLQNSGNFLIPEAKKLPFNLGLTGQAIRDAIKASFQVQQPVIIRKTPQQTVLEGSSGSKSKTEISVSAPIEVKEISINPTGIQTGYPPASSTKTELKSTINLQKAQIGVKAK